MDRVAKLFKNPINQSVRSPVEFEFEFDTDTDTDTDTDKVYIRRDENGKERTCHGGVGSIDCCSCNQP
ncbi:Uncharacterised protein [Yersinia enterocolitica]|nr:Uncharacterised protein [Yersinia enterocolitica]CNF23825.1 Uncharacterised protein [Yersinia enterocolitica]CNI78193.1 Uncharacterised protein [Yersinia enterocolitica]